MSRAGRTYLAGPLAQAGIAVFSCLAVAAAWRISEHPFGALVAFALLLLPLVNVPFEICLSFVLLSQFRLPEVFPVLYPFRIPQLLAVATLGALLWHLFATRRIRPFWCVELTMFALFFTHVTFASLLASNPAASLEAWTNSYVKVGIMTLAVAWLAVGPRQFAIASRAFVVAGLAVGTVALLNKINGVGLVEGSRVTIGRDIGSILGDPNELAITLLFPTAFACGLAATHGVPRLSRALGWVAAIACLSAIIATQSRGGLLGMIAVLIPFIRMRVRSPLLLAGLGVGGILLLFVAAGISGRATATAPEGAIDESAMGRLVAWEAAIRMAIADPLSGVGPHLFPQNFYFYTDQWLGKAIAAHSVWFEVLGETGLLGLMLFVAMIGVTAGKLLRANRKLQERGGPALARATSISLLAALAGFVVSASFLSQAYSWPIYMIMAFAIGIIRYADAGEWLPTARAGDLAVAAPPPAPPPGPLPGRIGGLEPDGATAGAHR